MNPINQKAMRFMRKEDGGATVMSLFLSIGTLMVGGYAIDFGNAIMARTNLQIAADAAAHAALLTRELKSEPDAIAAAHNVALLNMPQSAFGSVLSDADIVFGDYDAATGDFTPRSGSRNAVEVTTRLSVATDNPLPTFMLKLVGIDEWNVTTTSVFATYTPTCLREGFVSQGVVDIQSNNNFQNGFCVHSNAHVSMNSNNTFEPGTIVSMADLDDLELPNSGFRTNTGLRDALREGSWNIRIINRIEAVIAGLDSYDPDYLPSYITSTTPVNLTDRTVDQSHLVAGRVHKVSCAGSQKLTFKSGVLVKDIVLVTNCAIFFSEGVVVENSVIATKSIASDSMKSASGGSGFQVGKNDSCADGGGAQLVTLGSMSFPAKLSVFGSQLLAKGDITFAANADGIQGAAMVAGGQISGTSNMSMAFCGSGMDSNFQAEYFKLVM